MKYEQLRYGNWCLVSSFGEKIEAQFKYCELGFHYTFFNHSREKIHADEKLVEFIPLTEQWLKEFGFFMVDEMEDWYWQKQYDEYLDSFKVFKDINKDVYYIINVNHFGLEIKYVHQLQNLYFSLTGKELTRK